MRSIRGWIINLRDGLAPPPSTVGVRATAENTNTDLDLSEHGLGHFDRVHQLGGSVSPNLADPVGHFGWDMELSPGLIDVAVTPSDPQLEYRRRFPDESSQIGKAFLSDLERVGWAGGKSGMIWNALPNSGVLTDILSWDGTESWQQGNGSIASFGSGDLAGRFVLRRFVAILGAVPFSVEMSDLVVPITGTAAAPPNASGSDRWDLYCLAMHDESGSSLHGKQVFELFQGSPGGGFPLYPAPSGSTRRIPLHLLKMPAGSSVYTDAFDVRLWLNPPYIVRTTVSSFWGHPNVADQNISAPFRTMVSVESTVNATWPSFLHLPMTSRWIGSVHWDGLVEWDEGDQGDSFLEIDCAFRGVLPNGSLDPAVYTPFNPATDPDFAHTSANTKLVQGRGFGLTYQGRAHATWHVILQAYSSEDSVFDPVVRLRQWTNFRIQFYFRNFGLPRCIISNQMPYYTVIPR